jgi:Carboxypeptidase regulatory-like domain
MRKSHASQIFRYCVALAASFLISIAAFAQSDVGTITGFVLDPSSAGVPNATVVIKNEAINEEHRVTTDSQGHYTVPNLLPGLYRSQRKHPGSRSSRARTTGWTQTRRLR